VAGNALALVFPLVRLAGVYQFQTVALQNPLDLMFGVYRPRARRVEFHVRTPVLQRFARLAPLLIGQGKVVVRVGVGRRQLNRGLISVDRFFHPPCLIQHIAQVEIGQRVARIDLDRRTVVPFRKRVFLRL